MGADIFYRERLARHLAEQDRRVRQPKLPVQRAQAPRLGTFPYDADLDVRDSRAEHGGRAQQIVQPLARVHPRDREHGRPGRPRAGGLGEAAPPVGEIDRLGHDRERRSWDGVDVVGDRRGVLARHDDAIGARGVGPLPARLQGEQRAHQAALVP